MWIPVATNIGLSEKHLPTTLMPRYWECAVNGDVMNGSPLCSWRKSRDDCQNEHRGNAFYGGLVQVLVVL